MHSSNPTRQRQQELAAPGRRRFLRSTVAAAGVTLLPGLVTPAFAENFWDLPRRLNLYRPVTGESVNVIYWENGKLIQPEYKRLCWLLRDVHVGVATEMSVDVLNVVAGAQGYFRAYGQERVYNVTSGLRTPKTNERTEGAVKDSRHLIGGAIDGYMQGVQVDYLGKLFIYLEGGGVGIYEQKKFIHVDDGRVRTWKG